VADQICDGLYMPFVFIATEVLSWIFFINALVYWFSKSDGLLLKEIVALADVYKWNEWE
jgi:hypothetical protein